MKSSTVRSMNPRPATEETAPAQDSGSSAAAAQRSSDAVLIAKVVLAAGGFLGSLWLLERLLSLM